MASTVSTGLCLLLITFCSLTLRTNGMSFLNQNTNKDFFLFRNKNDYRVPENIHLKLIDNSPLLSSSVPIQRRNAIMPRICYFTRISKKGVYQKLCLPYHNDS